MVAALGVVFGDIGTSPIYSVQTLFERSAIRPLPIDDTSIYGVISLIFWSLTAIVTVLYVTLFMSADNEGEGGLLSLLSLLQRRRLSKRTLKMLLTLGIFGAALFIGDSMITPAISVLSSVEGVAVVDPGLHDVIVPGAVAILAALLVVQRWGSGRVGRFFGPVMAVWFVCIALCGVPEIVRSPQILEALSPHWAVLFIASTPLAGFLSLGGVVLVLTGAEALYADMGHFGRPPITRAWLFVVFPCLVLNYLGQGALLLRSPASVSNPFFLLVPHWARIPMVVLATAATAIASQSVISGAFSVASQASRLHYLPRLRVIHTSQDERGQIYIPAVNWLLAVAIIALVVGFRSSVRLSAAYGLAVIGTITITTVLFFVLQARRRVWPRPAVLGGGVAAVVLLGCFLAANSVKITDGGWLPVGIAIVFFVLLTTWHRGRELSNASRDDLEGDLQSFVDSLREPESDVTRVPGCAVFLSRGEGSLPLALRSNVQHNRMLHESTVILTLVTETSPRVPREEQVTVDDLGFADDGISHVTARLGYLDHPRLPTLLRDAVERGLEADAELIEHASYFLSLPQLAITRAAGMATWRKHLFKTMTRLTADPVEFFDVPHAQSVVLGSEIDF